MRAALTSLLALGMCVQWSLPAHAAALPLLVERSASAQEPGDAPAEGAGEPGSEAPEGDGAAPPTSVEAPEPTPTEAPAMPAESTDTGEVAVERTEGMEGVAVLPVLVQGEISDAARETLLSRLRKGIARGSFFLIEQSVTNQIAATGCSDNTCYQKLQSDGEATYMVRTFVSVDDRDYKVKLDLVDLRSGEPAATSEEGCELCGVAEVGSVLEAQGAQIGKKLEDLVKEPPTLKVTTKPEGALVMVDGQVVGVTPLDRRMLAGAHVVRVSYEGYIPEEREIESVIGVAESLDVELKRTPESRALRAVGWTFVGVSVPLIAGGIATNALVPNGPDGDGNYSDPIEVPCSMEVQDSAGNCPNVFANSNRWLGVALMAGGGALLASGIVLLVRYSDRKGKARRKKASSSKRAQIRPTLSGLEARF